MAGVKRGRGNLSARGRVRENNSLPEHLPRRLSRVSLIRQTQRERIKKLVIGLNNNFARASYFFVHFFAVFARLPHEVLNFAYYGERKQATT